jgi:hypothetical protein
VKTTIKPKPKKNLKIIGFYENLRTSTNFTFNL